jgi:hypothetical protein
MFSVACNPRKAQEKQADERLKIIEQLINENALNTAKFHIDSIHSLFPKLVEKRRIAAAFGDTITRRESARNLAYCDSILPLKQHEADSIQKKFRFEKDTVYQEFGNFVYKTQRTESNANRTYLKSYVDENANFFLISNYTGGKIEHISVLVSSNDLFAQTDSIETTHPNYHSFDDGGTHWETITFKNENDKGVASFISQYSSERIKVTLLGKKKYIYYLDESDKKAITETYNLWVVKRDISKLMDEIKKSKIRIERINQRKSKS